ncbi:hypothetical protein TNCT_337161 [Trichonephila clavata]|uniref:Uncharacterized protein n=1 Tax=Trichonephila clavata TaxID=2740835 RepID=A0A8X6FA62_TRICU|nr:hypothetical protein TNCT_337161 [Trichonephila clavata]
MATGHLPTFTAVEFNYFFSYDKALYVEIRVVCVSTVWWWYGLKMAKTVPSVTAALMKSHFLWKTVYSTALGTEGNLHSITVAALCKLGMVNLFFRCLSPDHVLVREDDGKS